MKTDYPSLRAVFDLPAFKDRKDSLVAHYSISASAKYTLAPRDDFIFKVIREFLEVAQQYEIVENENLAGTKDAGRCTSNHDSLRHVRDDVYRGHELIIMACNECGASVVDARSDNNGGEMIAGFIDPSQSDAIERAQKEVDRFTGSTEVAA